MKLFKIALISLIAIFFIACSEEKKEDNFGLRTGDLLDESSIVADPTNYSTDVAGTSTKIKRAFENAPPMIPHDTEGMLPITIDNNQCTMCHDPMIAESMGATPLPKSHFTDFREGVKIDNKGNLIRDGKNVDSSELKTIVKPLDHLSNARFNCSACHAPQSENQNVPKNNFTTEFRSIDLNDKSNLIDVLGEGVK
ncbi:Periplasmic nitrate reductase, electron transfer subunit precursor [Aliarcobacter thereius]|uniref:Periplasmic nitrate reductase, electron transfer subunit n=2 Tax=Aliarcobacter thereius TaxID=544718 RepID=A0A1C0B849_9BACT|nr:nitrate reductase cytochrome c-type subunit [Aliarcobacter thereius]OCL87680.1 Periplasmic nitrate reductase, electron transfer subunit precursor [Aliarcobacter thereius]OCL93936.1 Periplasmic nitrate reductase, electron transfer subunit precursor [Aliarcobacter thereius]OCL95331.1 Periplasmic nitrate reductase, electron transfer subunit precursor [Aliarcobacter thereius LMG 24486]OCL99776.1 Periplasmic nitrate reductase, electron transfer subunit precursor [Aliarcobacter thereius]QBF16680.